jgi:hypothetical protein
VYVTNQEEDPETAASKQRGNHWHWQTADKKYKQQKLEIKLGKGNDW